MATSTISRARPTSIPECFFKISAPISVPPVEALILNKIAAPTAGRITAKKSSSIFSSPGVSGLNGKRDHVMDESRKEKLWDFLLLNAGTILVAVGVYFFKFPNHFSMGGVSGLSILLGQAVQVDWLGEAEIIPSRHSDTPCIPNIRASWSLS